MQEKPGHLLLGYDPVKPRKCAHLYYSRHWVTLQLCLRISISKSEPENLLEIQ